MVLLYETKKAKGKGCTMIRNGKKPFPKPAFDLTIQHQGGSYQYKSVQSVTIFRQRGGNRFTVVFIAREVCNKIANRIAIFCAICSIEFKNVMFSVKYHQFGQILSQNGLI